MSDNHFRSSLVFAIACTTSFVACASPAQPVPTYPKLPANIADDAALSVRFEPVEGVVSVPLACAGAELPDNGIDDDCDGYVDARTDGGPYLAIAHAADLGVEVVLRRVDGTAVATFVSGGTQRCTEHDAAQAHVDGFSLERGSYELVAKRNPACAPVADGALSVSLGQGRTRQVFATGALSDAPHVLGRVIVTQLHDSAL